METVKTIFTIIGLIVTVASIVILVMPAVNRKHIVGKIIWCVEHFSVFLARGSKNANKN